MEDSNQTTTREKLTENFYRDEFACPCCGSDRIDRGLVSKLQELRNEYGRALIINSGVRCLKHNDEVKGAKYSSHIYGFAVDIACTDASQRWELIPLCQKIFKRVGKYDSWVHVDVDPNKPQNKFW